MSKTATNNAPSKNHGHKRLPLQAGKSQSLDYTHFVSLPLAFNHKLVEKLTDFQNSVLGNYGAASSSSSSTPSHIKPTQHSKDNEVEKSIFINPATFHLTVLMLKLGNKKDRVDAASTLLKAISSEVMNALENKPVVITLKGLDLLGGTVEKARVLYAPVEKDDNEKRLTRACYVIIDAFIAAGLAETDAKQRFKLHATLMNVKYRKSKSKEKKFDSFDARDIFKHYGKEKWGEYVISEAHLSQRFSYDKNRYFHCCASLNFPENSQGMLMAVAAKMKAILFQVIF